MINRLIHNGIVIPKANLPEKLELTVRGGKISLNQLQIEMAMAWARKQGTPYVEDKGFVFNFMQDFSKALAIEPPLATGEVDFSPAVKIVADERTAREKLTKEEKKLIAALRKAEREKLKENYGYAIVNDERVELANYLAEPSSIFMGRGKHPLRGHWKQGPAQSDITLNLSPDAPLPPGQWAAIVWEPETLWVARWQDKLSDKIKYIWLHDTVPIKQEREAAKFDKAVKLEENMNRVREHIQNGLVSKNEKERMVATVCSLIDALCLRVGDEKDSDEADTVGATTLRPEHIVLHDDDFVEFKFLGKDSVLWHKKIELPHVVVNNLAELLSGKIEGAAGAINRRTAAEKIQIFDKINSSHVNGYLGQTLEGLTAKVFRTHHATRIVEATLEASGIEKSDPDYKKWTAVAEANLQAAILCNHYKTIAKNWQERRKKARERLQSLADKTVKSRDQLSDVRNALAELKLELKEKKRAVKKGTREKIQARYAKKIASAQKKIIAAEARVDRSKDTYEKTASKDTIVSKTRTWNLGTSLKSYIDPRVFYRWGEKVGFDVLNRYYPKTLQLKFAWAKEEPDADEIHGENGGPET